MSVRLRCICLAVVALALASALNLRLAARAGARPYDVAHVPSAAAMRVLALGHRTLVSDLYWLSAVQYIGEPKAPERGWDMLLPLLDLVTDLDPRHGYAYQTGGIVLASAGRLDESNRILEKGMRTGPRWWTFPYYVSFNHWFYLGDFEKGAEYARIAAQTPGASLNVSHLALSLAAKRGTPEDAIEMLGEMRKTVADEASADRLDHQLKLAIVERDAQGLEAAIARFEAEQNRPLIALDELVWTGHLRALPQDPFGGRYVRGADGRIRSSENSFRFTKDAGVQHQPGFYFKPSARDLEEMPR